MDNITLKESMNEIFSNHFQSNFEERPESHESKIKKIIITDVSRINNTVVCIFGYDKDGNPIRPTIGYGIPKDYLFNRNGNQIISPFSVVDLSFKQSISKPPHSEDYLIDLFFEPLSYGKLSKNNMKKILRLTSFNSLEEIVGVPVETNNNKRAFINPNQGLNSIGTIKSHEINFVEYKDHIYRIKFFDSSGNNFDLSVSDCAFREFCDGKKELGESEALIGLNIKELLDSHEVYLRLGLTREYQGKHWFQVTGVYSFPDYRY